MNSYMIFCRQWTGAVCRVPRWSNLANRKKYTPVGRISCIQEMKGGNLG